ncbi:hypothetical protein NBRC116590_03010 [Pelagimonas sp. KU-00592-HH]|uniref:helix-turn-helix transcriptional regulator n=1 Tax=Pelagimonas sp. KU-00592-HH TaxID=3127651 RepID=UPI00310A3BB4
MTKLAQYLKDSQIRQEDFAEEIGVKQGTVSRFASGRGTPGLELAVAIEDATGGAVPARSWVNQQEAAE